MVGRVPERLFPPVTKYRWLGQQTQGSLTHPLGSQSKGDYKCKLSLKVFCVFAVKQVNGEANHSPAEGVSCVFIGELVTILALCGKRFPMFNQLAKKVLQGCLFYVSRESGVSRENLTPCC